MGAPDTVNTERLGLSSCNPAIGVALSLLMMALTGCGGGSDTPAQEEPAVQEASDTNQRSAQALAVTQAVEWTKLADQGSAFQLLETRIVKFGVEGKWTSKRLSGLMACDVSTFGVDPAPGVTKTCQVKVSTTGSSLALLAWTASPDPAVTGYRVYYGTSPGAYGQAVGAGFLAGNVPKFSFGVLPAGTYYFAVTAIDATGRESSYSNEVIKKIAPL